MSEAIGWASHIQCTTTLGVKVHGIGIKGSGLDHIAKFSKVLYRRFPYMYSGHLMMT